MLGTQSPVSQDDDGPKTNNDRRPLEKVERLHILGVLGQTDLAHRRGSRGGHYSRLASQYSPVSHEEARAHEKG